MTRFRSGSVDTRLWGCYPARSRIKQGNGPHPSAGARKTRQIPLRRIRGVPTMCFSISSRLGMGDCRPFGPRLILSQPFQGPDSFIGPPGCGYLGETDFTCLRSRSTHALREKGELSESPLSDLGLEPMTGCGTGSFRRWEVLEASSLRSQSRQTSVKRAAVVARGSVEGRGVWPQGVWSPPHRGNHDLVNTEGLIKVADPDMDPWR